MKFDNINLKGDDSYVNCIKMHKISLLHVFQKIFLQLNKFLIMNKLIFLIIREKTECSNDYFSNWRAQLSFYLLSIDNSKINNEAFSYAIKTYE
jgi:hypothetical protein